MSFIDTFNYYYYDLAGESDLKIITHWDKVYLKLTLKYYILANIVL